MEAQLFLQNTLRERLGLMQAKNSSFSLRAFAKMLEVSPASLSEFLNGKRSLSPKMVMKVANKLCLSPQEIDELSEKVQREKKGVKNNRNTKDNKVVQIQNDQYYMVSDWHYYAVKQLVSTSDFVDDYDWMAQRLKTNKKKIKEVVERLLRLGVFYYNNEGVLSVQNIKFDTTNDIPNTSLKRRHSDLMDSAKESLFNDDVLVRDFFNITVAIDPNKLGKAKKMMRDFLDKLTDELNTGETTEVYEFCTQMFPRTDVKKDKIYESYH